jgi:hypothetical protein
MKRIASNDGKLIYFFIGAFLILSLVLLTGAGPSQQYGRYQISSWSFSLGEGAGGCGAFIVDTATGTTKSAYTVLYGNPGKPSLLKNDLRKPFVSIQ